MEVKLRHAEDEANISTHSSARTHSPTDHRAFLDFAETQVAEFRKLAEEKNEELQWRCYISLALSVVLPLQRIPNPNGTDSLAANPAVVCWDSEVRGALAGLGVVGLLC